MIKLDVKSGDHVKISLNGKSIITLNTKDGEPTVYLADSVRIGTEVAKRDGKTVSVKRKTKTNSGRKSRFTRTQMKRMITCREKGLNASDTAIKIFDDESLAGSVRAFWANHTRGAYNI